MQRTLDGRRQRRISDGKGTEPRRWTGFPKAVKIQTPIMVAVHRGQLARSGHARIKRNCKGDFDYSKLVILENVVF